jgi:UDP-N-acetylmuramate--alanine ligase
VPEGGHIIANADDQGAMDSVRDLGREVFTFGIKTPGVRCTADNVSFHDGFPAFDILVDGAFYSHVELLVAGRHNILNALAAAASAYVLGIPGDAVSRGLGTFTGAGRRFEHKGSYHGAEVYDDYAHHPDEVRATIASIRASMPGRRLVLAFQPHTYTRTHALFADFVRELSKSDVVLLAEIYAARERNTVGISSKDLADRIEGAIYCPTLPAVTEQLRQIVRPGDIVITMGAGDIFRAGEALLAE